MSKDTVEPEINLRGITSKLSVTIEGVLMNIVFFSNIDQYSGSEESEFLKLKRVTFGVKLERVRILLDKYHKDLAKKNKKLFTNLDKFITFRNRITHCGLTWKDHKPETFIIWDIKEDQSKYEHLHPIEYNLQDSYKYLNEVMINILPHLKSLTFEVQSRLENEHPSHYKLLTAEYNAPNTSKAIF